VRRAPIVLAGATRGSLRVQGLGEGTARLSIGGDELEIRVRPLSAEAPMMRLDPCIVVPAQGSHVWGEFAVGCEVTRDPARTRLSLVMQNTAGTAGSSGGSGFDVPMELPFSPPGQMIAPGSTWYFQYWYRAWTEPPPNPGSSANFSNALGVTF
jgi:hypothetical protein